MGEGWEWGYGLGMGIQTGMGIGIQADRPAQSPEVKNQPRTSPEPAEAGMCCCGIGQVLISDLLLLAQGCCQPFPAGGISPTQGFSLLDPKNLGFLRFLCFLTQTPWRTPLLT